MKILLDEMYSGLKEYLEVMGWEVETIQEACLTGASDRKVAEYTKKNNLIMITEDHKPAELASLLNARYILIDLGTKAKMIESNILEKYPQLKDRSHSYQT